MKIVLLCVGGISSSILAKRLQKHSDENGKGDVFVAERYGTVSYGGIDADLFLIAPQISMMITNSPEFEIIPAEKVLYVSEEDYSSINVESVYGRIEQQRQKLLNPEQQKEYRLSKELLLNVFIFFAAALLTFGLIRIIESSFSISFGIARILLPLMIMCRFAATVAEMKKENMVLHMANLICLFMMIVPFTLIRHGEMPEMAESMILIRELNVLQASSYFLGAMLLYGLYNLWEDWFRNRNRFMIRIMREALSSGAFFLLVIVIRLIIVFFVTG